MSGSFESVQWMHMYTRAMECVCAQTRPRFILSSEKVLGNGVRTHVDSSGEKNSAGGLEKGGTREASSRRTASPTHYRLSHSSPHAKVIQIDCEICDKNSPKGSAFWYNCNLK